MVFGYKVFSAIGSILGWSQSVLLILPYNPLIRSARLYGQFFLDKTWTICPGPSVLCTETHVHGQGSAKMLVHGCKKISSCCCLTTLIDCRSSPGKGETAALPRAGHFARFSISGRWPAVDQGIMPGPAWLLLNQICIPFSRSLYLCLILFMNFSFFIVVSLSFPG